MYVITVNNNTRTAIHCPTQQDLAHDLAIVLTTHDMCFELDTTKFSCLFAKLDTFRAHQYPNDPECIIHVTYDPEQ